MFFNVENEIFKDFVPANGLTIAGGRSAFNCFFSDAGTLLTTNVQKLECLISTLLNFHAFLLALFKLLQNPCVKSL